MGNQSLMTITSLNTLQRIFTIMDSLQFSQVFNAVNPGDALLYLTILFSAFHNSTVTCEFQQSSLLANYEIKLVGYHHIFEINLNRSGS